MELSSIPELIAELRQGRMVILVDDEDRENEGDLILATDFVTPNAINFMATHARGLICLALNRAQIERLQLPLMTKAEYNQAPLRTAFTVSIEAAHGVTTGISAADRAHTVKVAADPNAKPQDVIVPGHIFPIRAQEGGVLRRAGHTEASVDLVRLAGLNPAAVICEIMNSDGTMARLPELKVFAKEQNLKVGSIESLIEYRLRTETFVEEVAQAPFVSEEGSQFRMHLFRNQIDGREHLALVKGVVDDGAPVLVRVHNENVINDVFRLQSQSSGDALRAAMARINEEGSGVVLYLRNENMSTRLLDQVKALDSKQPKTESGIFDQRDYGVGAQILRALGLHKISLLTNNPTKRVGIKGFDLEIVEMRPLFKGPESQLAFLDSKNDFIQEPSHEL